MGIKGGRGKSVIISIVNINIYIYINDGRRLLTGFLKYFFHDFFLAFPISPLFHSDY